jgi:hypothetical protein
MNEQIKLMLNCATNGRWSRWNATSGEEEYDISKVMTFSNKEMEKFAELIIKECMRLGEEQYRPVLEDTEMMMSTYWDGYVQCGVDSYVAIRQHFFGVKE